MLPPKAHPRHTPRLHPGPSQHRLLPKPGQNECVTTPKVVQGGVTQGKAVPGGVRRGSTFLRECPKSGARKAPHDIGRAVPVYNGSWDAAAQASAPRVWDQPLQPHQESHHQQQSSHHQWQQQSAKAHLSHPLPTSSGHPLACRVCHVSFQSLQEFSHHRMGLCTGYLPVLSCSRDISPLTAADNSTVNPTTVVDCTRDLSASNAAAGAGPSFTSAGDSSRTGGNVKGQSHGGVSSTAALTPGIGGKAHGRPKVRGRPRVVPGAFSGAVGGIKPNVPKRRLPPLIPIDKSGGAFKRPRVVPGQQWHVAAPGTQAVAGTSPGPVTGAGELSDKGRALVAASSPLDVLGAICEAELGATERGVDIVTRKSEGRERRVDIVTTQLQKEDSLSPSPTAQWSPHSPPYSHSLSPSSSDPQDTPSPPSRSPLSSPSSSPHSLPLDPPTLFQENLQVTPVELSTVTSVGGNTVASMGGSVGTPPSRAVIEALFSQLEMAQQQLLPHLEKAAGMPTATAGTPAATAVAPSATAGAAGRGEGASSVSAASAALQQMQTQVLRLQSQVHGAHDNGPHVQPMIMGSTPYYAAAATAAAGLPPSDAGPGGLSDNVSRSAVYSDTSRGGSLRSQVEELQGRVQELVATLSGELAQQVGAMAHHALPPHAQGPTPLPQHPATLPQHRIPLPQHPTTLPQYPAVPPQHPAVPPQHVALHQQVLYHHQQQLHVDYRQAPPLPPAQQHTHNAKHQEGRKGSHQAQAQSIADKGIDLNLCL